MESKQLPWAEFEAMESQWFLLELLITTGTEVMSCKKKIIGYNGSLRLLWKVSGCYGSQWLL
jgi:hypothetical protein